MNPRGADDYQGKAVSLILLLGTLVIYAPVSYYEFIAIDDGLFITANPMVRAGLTWEGLVWAFGTSGVDYWRPLSWLSHMVDVELFGLEAGAHHAMSLLWHAANAVVLFHALRRITGALWPSAFVAALFAWHPLHVESVAWVAERKDVMCAFFWFLTMGAYVRYAEAPSWRRYGLVVLCFVLGLMSKPMIVTLPCVLLLLDVWPLRRWELPDWRIWRGGTPTSTLAGARPPATMSRLVLEKLPLLLLGAVVSQATYVAADQIGAVRSLASISLAERLNNSLGAYAAYLGKMFWPVDLAVIYQFQPWGRVPLLLAAMLLVSLTTLAVWQARARPYLLVGWLWFLGTLVPVIGLVQAGGQSFADRYTYLPLIGVFIMLAWGMAELPDRWPHRAGLLKSLGALALIGCLLGTGRQLGFWSDSLTLFRHTLAVTAPKAMPLTLYASALVGAGQSPLAAIPLLEEALRQAPNYSDAQLSLARCYLQLGNHPQARGWISALLRQPKPSASGTALKQEIIRFVEQQPDNPEAHYDLAVVWAATGQTTNALHEYGEALRLRPDYVEVWIDRGALLAGERRFSEAAAHYREASRLSPTNDLARANLGGLLLDAGQAAEAVIHLTEALRLRPDNAATRHNLALALTRLGRDADAEAEFRAVLQRQPNNLNSMNKLAWLLATSPTASVRDGPAALRLAERVRELVPGQAAAHDTLAAAYAEAGQFAEALTAAQQAIKLAQQSGQTRQVAEYRARLALYLARQPYRTPPSRTTPP